MLLLIGPTITLIRSRLYHLSEQLMPFENVKFNGQDQTQTLKVVR